MTEKNTKLRFVDWSECGNLFATPPLPLTVVSVSPLSHLSVPFSTIIRHHNQHTSLCLLFKLLTVACPVGSIQTWISPFFITFFSSNFKPMQVVIVFPVAMPLVHRLGKPSDGFN